MLDRLFAALRDLLADGGDVKRFDLDRTSVRVHPDGTAARKTSGPQSIGKSPGGWYAKIHMVSASDCLGPIFSLSSSQAHDAPDCRALLESWDKLPANAPLAMDRAYQGNKIRHLVETLGMTPVVLPKANRKAKWDYDQEFDKLRNEAERLFRRFKGYRRIYTRFDELDVRFLWFLSFALIVEMIYDLA